MMSTFFVCAEYGYKMLQVAGCSGFKSSSKHLMHIKLCSTLARLGSVKYPSQSEDSSLDMSRIYVLFIHARIYTHIHHIYSAFISTCRHIRTQIRNYVKIQAILSKKTQPRILPVIELRQQVALPPAFFQLSVEALKAILCIVALITRKGLPGLS